MSRIFISLIAGTMLCGVANTALGVGQVSNALPNYKLLEQYEPPVMTRVHAENGALMAEFATNRRLYLSIQSVPDMVRAAFISAEDKNFYTHFGLDPEGLARAVVNNLKNVGGAKRPEGASTITQQVAKNFLLSSDPTLNRKVKEAILSIRIEKAYSKERILELYLNEIYLGQRAYGIAAAALTYFNKSVGELTLEEAAYLAALPKGPSNYDPFTRTDRAIARRNWVIDRMVEDGHATKAEGEAAKSKPLGVKKRGADTYVPGSEYFTEEVRRRLLDRYDYDALYEGGLSVRTTLNPEYQKMARKVLNDALIKFDQNYGWRGAYETIDDLSDWGVALKGVKGFSDIPEWKVAVVLRSAADGVTIGIAPTLLDTGAQSAERVQGFIPAADMKWAYRLINPKGRRSTAKDPSGVLKPGDVIFVEKKALEGNGYSLRQAPKVQGAIVAMDPVTGRVLAMSGGFSYSQSEFNRATQANRQPGSAFKPFVYAAALDSGYTPASVVLDGPVAIGQVDGSVWRPKNYGGTFAGPSTLRYGIEQSRNLMTVRLANDVGMPVIADYAQHFGIYNKMEPVLSMALGAGETTVMKMVTAYSVLANGGRSITPSLVDRIQDRYGKTIYRHDQRICEGCNVDKWANQSEPKVVDNRDQVLDAMTAYQVTSMLEGVVQRGTAKRLKYLKRHIAGKTGTTNDSKDAWFIGYTPNLVVGVFIGYDKPASLGFGGTGSGLAAPIFGNFVSSVLKNSPDVNFKMPAGMKLYSINRKTGMRSSQDPGNVIVEAFKPGTGPADLYRIIGGSDSFQEGVRVPIISRQVKPNAPPSGLY